ncbi:MAG: methylase [SAR86 cluster bacterium]|uniref:Methylase n=1 Tax=SAR86 cluster bacterium TaxID=2030880 RepID=A0A2A5AT58_9GAMM|nr:MAG: methylase [SAR86 cluster bacterium]
MNNSLPFSQACENNKQVILDILKKYLKDGDSVLEIAGGTGQHAEHFIEYFSAHCPDLHWQSSDIPSNVDSLNLRIESLQRPSLPLAISLDVNQTNWNCDKCNVIYSANSLHIMSAASVENFFSGAGKQLPDDGLLFVYGPFKYEGEFTTESNAHFDLWLKDRDTLSGVRDFEWVVELAKDAGLDLLEDNSMPANNQILIWRKNNSGKPS